MKELFKDPHKLYEDMSYQYKKMSSFQHKHSSKLEDPKTSYNKGLDLITGAHFVGPSANNQFYVGIGYHEGVKELVMILVDENDRYHLLSPTKPFLHHSRERIHYVANNPSLCADTLDIISSALEKDTISESHEEFLHGLIHNKERNDFYNTHNILHITINSKSNISTKQPEQYDERKGEYDQQDILKLIYSTLEQRNVKLYETKLANMSSVVEKYMPPGIETKRERFEKVLDFAQFSTTPIFSLDKERDEKLDKKVVASLAPATASKITIQGRTMDDFQVHIDQALFDYENYLHENEKAPQKLLMTIPLNLGDLHWVACFIDLDRELLEAKYHVIDPMWNKAPAELPGYSYRDLETKITESFTKYFVDVINRGIDPEYPLPEEALEGSFEIKYDPPKEIYMIQQSNYCGGLTRRLICGKIFNDDPYNWNNIDLVETSLNHESSCELLRAADEKALKKETTTIPKAMEQLKAAGEKTITIPEAMEQLKAAEEFIKSPPSGATDTSPTLVKKLTGISIGREG